MSNEATKEIDDYLNSKEAFLDQNGDLRYGINDRISVMVLETFTRGFIPVINKETIKSDTAIDRRSNSKEREERRVGLLGTEDIDPLTVEYLVEEGTINLDDNTLRFRILGNEDLSDDIHEAAHEAATSPLNDIPEPTEPMYKAGNYKMGHITLHGLNISIENPKGSVRSGVDKDGKEWSNTIHYHYGYIKGSVGADKDHLDIFIGDDPESEKFFVINQIHPHNGKFDEHKVMAGFNTETDAVDGYKKNYEKNWRGIGSVTEITLDELKGHIKNSPIKYPITNDNTNTVYGIEKNWNRRD